MTTVVNRHVRPEPHWFGQWLALSGRGVHELVTSGGLAIAVVAPLIFTIGYYLPLKYVMQVQGIDYAQFVMAIIVLQTMSFTMNAAAASAGAEAITGFAERMRTMPISPLVPFVGRMTTGLFRSAIALAAALAFGYLIGFRLHGGLRQTVLFALFALAVAMVLSFGADALGMYTRSPASVSQALTLPTLVFGMMSTGFVPETGFPAWIRPFARNQPVSQFAYVLRDLADPGASWQVAWPALAWLGGMAAVFVPAAVWANVRRS